MEQNSDNHLPEEYKFREGQEVTLDISTDQTRATSVVNSSKIDFKWEAGDKIKVMVGGSSSEFVLVTGAGEASGKFFGTMPASGSSFDVQFPVNDPDLANQVYSSSYGPIPHNMMKFTATNCNIGEAFTLSPQYAVLQLKLYKSSDYDTVGKVVVTNESASPKTTYTLNCGDGVVVGDSSNPTAFLLVVPSGNYKFSAEVFDNQTTPVSICTFSTPDKKNLEGAGVMVMAAKEVFKQIALPGEFSVSASKKVCFAPGNLQATYNSSTSSYSWGFAANQYDYIGNAAGNNSIGSQTDGAVVDLFGWPTSTNNYGISTSSKDSDYAGDFVDWGTITSLPGNKEGKKWSTLSIGQNSGEWYFLLNSRTGDKAPDISGTTDARYALVKVNSIPGLLIFPDTFTWPTSVLKKPIVFNGGLDSWSYITTDYNVAEFQKLESAGCVFLPTAGYRSPSSVVSKVLEKGTYRSSSTVSGVASSAYDLYFDNKSLATTSDTRCLGYSVRLVTVVQ